MSKDKYFGDHSIESKAFSLTAEGGLSITEAGSSSPISIGSGSSVEVMLGDNSGAQKVRVKDSGGIEVASIDSNGDIICNSLTLDEIFSTSGSLSFDSLTLNSLDVNEINVGGGYGVSGSTLFSNGNISMDGNLQIDGQVLLSRDGVGAKRSIKWIGGGMLLGGIYSPSSEWSTRSQTPGPGGTENTFCLDSSGSAFAYLHISDLPRGSVVRRVELYGYFHESFSAGGSAFVSIQLNKISGYLAPVWTNIGSDTWRENETSGTQKPGWISLAFDTNEEILSEGLQLEVFLNNDGTAKAIAIHAIVLDYSIPNLTPDTY
jgi:hypothetical protein